MKKAQQKQFCSWIHDGYGSPEEFAKIFDQGIEMLFYIEDDVFTKREIQEVVGAMRGIVNVLRCNT
ncbi:hypothetical protein [Flagellimonas sp. S3867]|uniref:hypothetical protein n=1 Tax=Flagellimonas sp. S3867 TaxID=2768063 RepID=UPI001684D1CC|nr:hypothetical protein [Flagellimonas sp. S3867]